MKSIFMNRNTWCLILKDWVEWIHCLFCLKHYNSISICCISKKNWEFISNFSDYISVFKQSIKPLLSLMRGSPVNAPVLNKLQVTAIFHVFFLLLWFKCVPSSDWSLVYSKCLKMKRIMAQANIKSQILISNLFLLTLWGKIYNLIHSGCDSLSNNDCKIS